MSPPAASRVAARARRRSFSQAFSNALNRYLNAIFALSNEAALVRITMIRVVFLVLWLSLTFFSHTREEYSTMMRGWVSVYAGGDLKNMLFATLRLFYGVFVNWVVIRHVLALYVPFWLMRWVAAIYLADIFEKEEKVARNFVNQAAFGGVYNTIHIRQGKIIPEDEDSPILQIGGPGYVVVELDSAVVFERPDGSSYVVRPPKKGEPGKALIGGFDRIRQGFDLRDVILKQEVNTRTRDGIPVTAKDIQYSYSIYRGPRPLKTPQTPYPFDETAAIKMVYENVRAVKLDEAPKRSVDWHEPLPAKIFGQIGSEMSRFINRRGLSDFLVAVGKPEEESLNERKKITQDYFNSLDGAVQDGPESATAFGASSMQDAEAGMPVKPKEQESSSDFVPRSMLTRMFYENFQDKAPQRGIQLNWIGVGTWDTPSQIILKNHSEAWLISRDNFVRGNPAELQRIYEEARQAEFLKILGDVPIQLFFSQLQGYSAEEQINEILKGYLAILERARELYRLESIPPEVLSTISEIERCLYSGQSLDEHME